MTESGTDQTSSGAGSNAVTSELSYGEALAELEELLTELEDADIDVDQLTQRVARGAELVRYCQERLAVVSGDVDKVVAELSTDHAPTGSLGDDLDDE